MLSAIIKYHSASVSPHAKTQSRLARLPTRTPNGVHTPRYLTTTNRNAIPTPQTSVSATPRRRRLPRNPSPQRRDRQRLLRVFPAPRGRPPVYSPVHASAASRHAGRVRRAVSRARLRRGERTALEGAAEKGGVCSGRDQLPDSGMSVLRAGRG